MVAECALDDIENLNSNINCEGIDAQSDNKELENVKVKKSKKKSERAMEAKVLDAFLNLCVLI